MSDKTKKRVLRRNVSKRESGAPKIIKKHQKDMSKFDLPTKESMEVERYKRELRRTRNSASFRIGNTIISNSILIKYFSYFKTDI